MSDCYFSDRLVQILLAQALWETSIALPPNYGLIGLLLASLVAFCIPLVFGISCGLGYLALESAYNEVLLTETQKSSGTLWLGANSISTSDMRTYFWDYFSMHRWRYITAKLAMHWEWEKCQKIRWNMLFQKMSLQLPRGIEDTKTSTPK